MFSFDCQLDHHPLVRIDAADPDAAKAEYFRRYAILGSTAAWNCKEAEAGSVAPVEPERWRERRKELGTLNEVAKEKPVEKAADKPADKPAAPAAPTKAKESGGVNVDAALTTIHKEPS